uniref:Uncharacterized protein n=1 Tax=Globisporangium ultimum (strain ATCC 200006 / CBS 805.95 / DAOM BR144) TaxID=431595 RepID=K3X2G0_GLOUD
MARGPTTSSLSRQYVAVHSVTPSNTTVAAIDDLREPEVKEQHPKQPENRQSFRSQANPLPTTSWLSLVLMHWIQPIVSLGARKVLEKDDIWELCDEDTCAALQERFQMNATTPRNRKADAGDDSIGDRSLMMALQKTFRLDMFVVLANYLVYVLIMGMQSYIVQAILDFLSDRENLFHIHNGLVLVAIMAGVSIVATVCLSYAFFVSCRVGLNMRSLLISQLYQKSLRLSCVARQSYSTGEIMTLMSVDTTRVMVAMVNGPWLVVAPVAFVITIVLISQLLDATTGLCGAAFILLVVCISVLLARQIGQIQHKLLQVAEARVKLTSETLHGIRVVKFYAWEASLAQRVEAIREQEVKLYRKFHYYHMANSTLLFMTPVLLGGVTMGFYVFVRGNLTVTQTFTLIAMLSISRFAVRMFPQGISAVSQARVAFARMDAFLSADEQDSAAVLPPETGDGVQAAGSIRIFGARLQWLHDEESQSTITTHHEEESPIVAFAFSPTPSTGFALEQINLVIEPGSLTMIIGVVGSGKSSVLHAILGEMILVRGDVDVHGEISYVSQQPWIRNVSIKDNILFENAYDANRYEHVLNATQLAQDLSSFSSGDRTEIGEHGINLSGGQKARVAIARAMYRAHYDILILDDPLSAVDPHVAHAVFEQCILGLAKKKTRLLVLNSHYDLLPHADKVLVVQDGRIAGDGTYTEILNQFPHLRTQRRKLDQAEQDLVDERPRLIKDEINAAGEATKGAVDPAIVRETIPQRTQQQTLSESGDNEASKLIKAEERIKGNVTAQTYVSYFDGMGLHTALVICGIVLIYGLSQGVRTIVDWWQAYWAKNMYRDGVDPTYSKLWFAAWYFGLIGICAVITLGRGLVMIECCIQSSKNLHDQLFRRVLRAPVNRYFDVTPIGRVLNRFSNDLDQMDLVLPQQYHNVFQNLTMSIGALAVCAMASFWIGVSYIPMLMIFGITGVYFKRTSREVKRLEGISRTPIFSLIGETLNGLNTIRAFKMQDHFGHMCNDAVDDHASVLFIYNTASMWLALRMDFVSVAISGVVSLYLVLTKGQLSAILAGMALTYSLKVTSTVQSTVRAFDAADNAMTSVERLLHFRTIPVEDDGANCASVNRDLWPSQGSIKFENVRLKYRPELPLVLRGVSIEVQGGEKLGICGRTGSGKSSLMAALFRMCEFESGTIFIDGVDIIQVKLPELRRSLAIIPQDPVLYSGSLRQNLDPFGECSDEAIWSALKLVHLMDNVTKWGASLEFLVSERGDNLSIGQRQLLCIARALLKNSKIVVLDEATASIDTATDHLIQSTMNETFAAKTMLIIAHRIHTILHCDKIAVMDAGRVVEFGSPESLLSQPTSRFAALTKRSDRPHKMR